MKLLEYEAKTLLHKHGLPIPDNQRIRSANTKINLPFPVVLKVQIPKGGRGKAGGIKIVNDQAESERTAQALLEEPTLGYITTSLLVEEKLDYEQELYLAIALDRVSSQLTLLAHKHGGIEIEQLADEHDPLFKISLASSPTPEIIKALSGYYDFSGGMNGGLGELRNIVSRLYEVCIQEDALLVEVNPLMVLKDGSLICADAKIELDDDAAFRHANRNAGFEAKSASNQFVELNVNGTIASMANGAGLAMATVDAIKAAGAEPANFYDVGGGTNVEGMVAASKRIAAMPKVESIVVNIFGGITRCDEVAQAIVEAKKISTALPGLYIRLTGTNETEGKAILEAAGILFYPTLADCVTHAVKAQ